MAWIRQSAKIEEDFESKTEGEKMMLRAVVAILPLLTCAAFANGEINKKQIAIEDAIGNFQIDLDFGFDRPVFESIHMDLNLLCKDHRTNPNSVTPTTEKLLHGEKICSFDAYKFDKTTKVLTLRFSTGQIKNNLNSCDEHWKQDFDLNELCEGWSAKGPRKPASEFADVPSSDDQPAAPRSRRGVHERVRVRGRDYYNSGAAQKNPAYDTNSLFSGTAVGTYPEQQGRRPRAGRGGACVNGRGEIICCPGLEPAIPSNAKCLSAIIAAESGCNATVHHSNNGIGLCAIENDSRRDRFGPACRDIRSTQGQINCCSAMYAKVGMAYFGGRTQRIAASACR